MQTGALAGILRPCLLQKGMPLCMYCGNIGC